MTARRWSCACPSRLSLYCSHCCSVYSHPPLDDALRENVRSVPNLVAKTERFYTNPDGSMTKLMYVAMFIGVCNGFHWCFCSPLIPSVVDAYAAGDALMIMGICAWSTAMLVGLQMWLLNTRYAVRSMDRPLYSYDGGATRKTGHTHRIGAGSTPVPRAVEKELNFHFGIMKMSMNPVAFWIPYGYIAWTGGGAQATTTLNRVGVAVLTAVFTVTRPMLISGIFSMRQACACTAAKVAKISKAVKAGFRGLDAWEEEVVRPLQELMECMDTLTEGYAPVVETFSCVMAPLMVFASVCLFLSPMTQTLDYAGPNTGRWVQGFFAVFAVLFTWGPLVLAGGVADVSTACDDLKEGLNRVRVLTMDPEVHNRVSILEPAMANCNHGQGVGFKVRNIVLDKKMLAKIALQIQSVVVFLAPIILSYRGEDGSGGGGGGGGSASRTLRYNGYVNATTMTCYDLGC